LLLLIDRFPGGESYRDLLRRLESVVVDLEQQVVPTLVVSHVSVLQVLIAYFRNSPVENCMSIEVPLHTVIKFTPVQGGGWSESCHPLCPADNGSLVMPQVVSESEMSNLTLEECLSPRITTPIWGDHMRSTASLGNHKIFPTLPLLG
jgi:broad specificity phosphatase PhoE